MKTILIVDDEASLILSLKAGFEAYSDQFNVCTAENGRAAVAILESQPIDLVVTDLKMPEMDGFELLAHLKNNFPMIPAIVMTAFNTPEIENRIDKLMSITLLDKPVEFDNLTQRITDILNIQDKGGTVSGISLPNFLQLIEMEEKTCLLEIKGPADQSGLFYFNKGELCDAVCGQLIAEKAAYAMLAFDDVQISFRNLPRKKIKKRIENNLMSLIMESSRQLDESRDPADDPPEDDDTDTADLLFPKDLEKEVDAVLADQNVATDDDHNHNQGDSDMSDINAILEKFGNVDGFQAVGVFSPQGELVAASNKSGQKLDELGALANDVLLKAQNTTEIMGVGRGNMVHIQAPKAQVIARCLNEATDFSASESGRAHIHMVLVLDNEGNLAMGKMKLDAIIQELAPEFR